MTRNNAKKEVLGFGLMLALLALPLFFQDPIGWLSGLFA